MGLCSKKKDRIRRYFSMKKYEKPSVITVDINLAETISAFSSFESFQNYETEFMTSYSYISGRGFEKA